MKTLNKTLAIFASILLLASCSKLEEKPESFISQDNSYTNKKQAVAGINGIYAILNRSGVYGSIYKLAEIPTDQGQTGGLFQPSEPSLVSLDNFTFNSSHMVFDDVWQAHYVGINDANLAIGKIPGIEMDAVEQKRLLAEAYFLRGLFYFNLVRWFGEVPLITSYTDSPKNLDISRENTENVYTLIISDLIAASINLPSSYSAQELGRATKGAALSLLGKVYLTRRDWQNAKETLKQVIDLNEYSLMPDYNKLWQTKNGIESIFSVQFKAGVINSTYSLVFAPRSSGIQAGQSIGDIAPTSNLMQLYAANDARLGVFKDRYNKYNSNEEVNFGHPFCFKYFDLNEGGNSGQNFPVLRYADVLLMYAEAQNELQGTGDGSPYSAAWALNLVRQRAGTGSATEAIYNQSTLREEIQNERSRELCFEGHRWFDLVRTNKLLTTAAAEGKNAASKNQLFPIPQREIDTNPKLVQNPGY